MLSNALSSLPVFAVALTLPMGAYAWGELGHETIGYVAMNFLSADTLSFVQSTIDSSFNNSLGPAAPWADTVREEKAFKFSAPFHFIDAEDDPLDGSCSVEESRDCGSSGCLLTAIANYTQRVTDTSLDSTQRQQALMFIDHFLGDIGQPLHVEAYEVGGNDIDAICNGKKTNLHASWDTDMIETYLDANFDGSVTEWAAALTKSIKTGNFSSDATGWISCSSITKTQSRRSLRDEIRSVIEARDAAAALPELACPLVWAKEANAYDCTDVFDFTTGEDLCTGTYFNSAIPIIELQIAKQGYRLAAWLNVITDGETNLP